MNEMEFNSRYAVQWRKGNSSGCIHVLAKDLVELEATLDREFRKYGCEILGYVEL